jgi:hypothetical protein
MDFGREDRVRVSKMQVVLTDLQPRQGAAAGPSHFIFCLRHRTPRWVRHLQADVSKVCPLETLFRQHAFIYDSQAIMLRGARSRPGSRLPTVPASLPS